ncbi:unnamed protein product, partial [Prorocentrum cordatum]
ALPGPPAASRPAALAAPPCKLPGSAASPGAAPLLSSNLQCEGDGCCWKTAQARCRRKRQASCNFCPQRAQMAKSSKVLEAILAGISSMCNSDWEALQLNMAKALSLNEQ